MTLEATSCDVFIGSDPEVVFVLFAGGGGGGTVEALLAESSPNLLGLTSEAPA